MKKAFLSIGALFLATLLRGQGFRIDMEISDLPDSKIMVSERIPHPSKFYIDSLYFWNGRACYSGSVAYPHLVSFVFCGKGNDFYGSFSIFLDNSSTIKIKGNNLKDMDIRGCKTHDRYRKLTDEGKELFVVHKRLHYERTKVVNDKRRYDSLKVLSCRASERLFDYILKQPDYSVNPVIPYFVYDLFSGDEDKLARAVAAFSPEQYANPYVKYCREELMRRKKTSIGSFAYDFHLQDTAGNLCHLSDYRGKYVLLEFSASWCGWCKKEIPFLKRVYERHKDDARFMMFTINLDKERKAWVREVEESALPWKTISDLKAFDGPAAAAYNVHGIPSIFLIDTEGRIAAKDLRGENMVKIVDSVLNKGKNENFEIYGEMKGLAEGKARLYSMSHELLDSCRVLDGKYYLKGRIESGRIAYIFFETSPESRKPFSSVVSFYIEQRIMRIYSESEDVPRTLKFVNAPVQNELMYLEKLMEARPEYAEARVLGGRIREAFVNSDMKTIRTLTARRIKLLKSLFCEFLDEDPGRKSSEAAFYLVWKNCTSFPAEDMEELLGYFDKSLDSTYYVGMSKRFIEKEKELKPGMRLPDFIARDTSGRDFSLKDFKGKYLFLEFSASWCGWCKKEIPFIRNAYRTFKDVVFVTVMMDDDREAWLNEIRESGMEWLSLSDLKGMKKSPMTAAYNLNGVPVSFLLSPEGIILARDLRGAEVENSIRHFLGSK